EEEFPMQAPRHFRTDSRLIRRQLLLPCLVSSLPHRLQKGEVEDRDDRRDLSAMPSDEHRLNSEGGTIDRLREVVAKLVRADGGQNSGRIEVMELRHTSRNGP